MSDPGSGAPTSGARILVAPSGARILIVRSGANPFARIPTRTGLQIVERVSHAIEPVSPPRDAFDGKSDFVFFTSQVTVERLLGDEALAPRLRAVAAGARVVAVGTATEGALRRHRLDPDIVAKGGGESILERLPRHMEGLRVLLPCAEDGTPELPDALRRRGATVARVPVYRKVPSPPDPELAREIVDRPFAAFCVTSPSAATWLFAGLPQEAAQRLRETPAVVLGPYTRRYLEAHGIAHIAVTEEARFDAAARMLETLAGADGAP